MGRPEDLHPELNEFLDRNQNKMTAQERILASLFGLSDEKKAEFEARSPEDKAAIIDRELAEFQRRQEQFIAQSSDPEFYNRSESLIESVVDRALVGLTPIEAQVIRARFGLDRGEQRSQAQVAQEVGRHIRTVQKIEARALRKLRTIDEGRDIRTLGRIMFDD